MKTIQERRLDFLNETVQYYSEDTSRRATKLSKTGDVICEYCTEDDRRCAIGRVIDIDFNESQDLLNATVYSSRKIIDKLPEEIKELDLEFLHKVQILHDGNDYWNEQGLTDNGIEKVKHIKLDYCS